ncbi:MAG: TonB-dependent receptor [Cellvibrionaceae bacterium]
MTPLNTKIIKSSFPFLKSPLVLSVAAAALSGMAPGYAYSEQASIEEIIVTAQRRSENMQSVPVSVSALSSSDLQSMQVSDIGDIQAAVPNLTLHQGDAQNAVVYIRGVGQVDSLAFSDPGVGLYLDDVYLGRAQGAFLEVFDVERIEVLRGPQGTLYGRNTIGGAVKYVTKGPSEEFTADVGVEIGSYENRRFKASVSGPLIDNLLLGKMSFAHSEREGYSDNQFDGESDGDKNLNAWRGTLAYTPSDNVSVTISADASKDSPDASRTPSRETPVFGVPKNDDPFTVNANFNDLSELEVKGVSATVTWDVNDEFQIKSITASRSIDYDTHLDLDATDQDIFGIFVMQEQEQFSQEFQFNYANDNLTIVSGLYFFNEEDVTESGIWGPDISLVTNSENDQENTSYAAYFNASHQLSEALTLTAGIRYTKEEKDFSRIQEMFFDFSELPQLGTGLPITDISVEDEWSSVSPRLGLDYQLNDDVFIYLNASRGFKSGGFDGRSNTAFEANPYDPETMWSYELGVKSEWFDNRLRLNTAVFYNDYSDMQISSFVADDSGSFSALFTNAGEATISGVELELTAVPIEGLTISSNLGYMDAEYKEYIGPAGEDISGDKELVNTPELTARLAVSYELPVGDKGYLTFVSDGNYRSKVYSTVSSSEVLAQDAYSLLNASVTFRTLDDAWVVTLGGKNLTDREYITHGFDLSDSFGYELGYYGAPRTYSLSVNHTF